MALKKQVLIGYECERCGNVTPAKSEFTADRPAGFYIQMYKITEGLKHYATPEVVYFCDKDCLVEGMKYHISHMVVPTTPIGPKTR